MEEVRSVITVHSGSAWLGTNQTSGRYFHLRQINRYQFLNPGRLQLSPALGLQLSLSGVVGTKPPSSTPSATPYTWQEPENSGCGPARLLLQPRGPADTGRDEQLSGWMSVCLPVSQSKAEHSLDTKKEVSSPPVKLLNCVWLSLTEALTTHFSTFSFSFFFNCVGARAWSQRCTDVQRKETSPKEHKAVFANVALPSLFTLKCRCSHTKFVQVQQTVWRSRRQVSDPGIRQRKLGVRGQRGGVSGSWLGKRGTKLHPPASTRGKSCSSPQIRTLTKAHGANPRGYKKLYNMWLKNNNFIRVNI